MGIDPGFRTGCKVVCLDRQGKLLHHDTVYPHTGKGRGQQDAEKLRYLCEKYGIQAVAVGNGTAGRETEALVRKIDFARPVSVDMGVHRDGLVHISEMADRFVKNPADVVRVQQPVHVTVIGVDLERKRISLSMKKNR